MYKCTPILALPFLFSLACSATDIEEPNGERSDESVADCTEFTDEAGQHFPLSSDVNEMSQCLVDSLPAESHFETNLYGHDEFAIWPTMTSNMIDWPRTGVRDWEVHRTYVRLAALQFESVDDELAEFWPEFDIASNQSFVPMRTIWKHRESGRLAMLESLAVPAGQSETHRSSPLGASDGRFLSGDEPLEVFQVLMHYDARDLGNFFDTCVPVKKGRVHYIACRNMHDAPRAVGAVRHEVWTQVSNDVDVHVRGIDEQIVRAIRANEPSELLPDFNE